ncbi:MAG TPA: ADOP family duplicated permease [Candidatus Limnocylindria bacterium]|nr:ADOP family duplicated permease [Candidatus Limnocylindria bacterium]
MNDLKFALRQLLKNPGFTAVAVVSLAIGIGLNSAVFSIINTVFFQTIRGVEQPRRVMLTDQQVPYAAYRHLQAENQTMSGLAATAGTEVAVQWDDQGFRKGIPAVSDNYFAMLGVRPLLGRFFELTAKGQPVPVSEIVLDYQFWQRRLNADPGVVGRTLRLNGSSFTIVGVAPEAFHGAGPERPFFWVPLGSLPQLEGQTEDWSDTSKRKVGIIGRLRPGRTLQEAQAEFTVLLAASPEFALARPLVLGAGREVWTGGTSVEKEAEFLLVTTVPLVAVGTILWIACSNVANLLLARAVGRRREIAIRLATGASRGRVIRLLLLESLLLALMGGTLGLLVTGWTVDFVFATFANFGSLAVAVDGNVLAYTAGIAVVSTLLFGLVPALQAARTDVAEALKSEGSGSLSGRRGSRLRTFFLITQVAGSMALLVVTITFVRSLVAGRFGEAGRQADHLLVAQVPEPAAVMTPATRQQQLRELLGAVPGVRAVTLLESGSGNPMQVHLPGTEAVTNAPTALVQRVDAAYFKTIGAELLRGHGPDPSQTATVETEVVLNEAALRQFWPGKEVMGQTLALDSSSGLAVVGLVRDHDDRALMYRPLPESASPANALLLTGPVAENLVGPTRQVLQTIASPQSFPQVAPLLDARQQGLKEITQVAALVGGVALLLAATGLYGSMAFSASQRTRELGVRLALGASRMQVVRLLIGQGLKIALTGCAVGLLLVLAAFQLMKGLIFGEWTLEPSVLAVVAAIFAAVTLFACWLPARRASRTDPMIVLRTE